MNPIVFIDGENILTANLIGVANRRQRLVAAIKDASARRSPSVVLPATKCDHSPDHCCQCGHIWPACECGKNRGKRRCHEPQQRHAQNPSQVTASMTLSQAVVVIEDPNAPNRLGGAILWQHLPAVFVDAVSGEEHSDLAIAAIAEDLARSGRKFEIWTNDTHDRPLCPNTRGKQRNHFTQFPRKGLVDIVNSPPSDTSPLHTLLLCDPRLADALTDGKRAMRRLGKLAQAAGVTLDAFDREDEARELLKVLASRKVITELSHQAADRAAGPGSLGQAVNG